MLHKIRIALAAIVLALAAVSAVDSASADPVYHGFQVSTQTQAQHCNLNVCAQFYRSFDPSDCTYQPNPGGARKTCDR
jgi:hypothetical protein